MSGAEGYTRVTLADLPSLPRPEGRSWAPVRHALGIDAFGVNAYTATRSGGVVIDPHDESDSRHEELYVVLSGAAAFTIDGRHVQGSRRGARPGARSGPPARGGRHPGSDRGPVRRRRRGRVRAAAVGGREHRGADELVVVRSRPAPRALALADRALRLEAALTRRLGRPSGLALALHGQG